MDYSKLELLRQVRIEKPCPEDWDAMTGDEQRRHCAGCGCSVHNVAEMGADEVEQLFASPDRVCARITVDDQQSVLTRDGWIPRMLLAGAVAATVAGCSSGNSRYDTPSDNKVVLDCLVDQASEQLYTVVPALRPQYVVAGAIVAPTSYLRSLPAPRAVEVKTVEYTP